jgi:hypothetical protein
MNDPATIDFDSIKLFPIASIAQLVELERKIKERLRTQQTVLSAHPALFCALEGQEGMTIRFNVESDWVSLSLAGDRSALGQVWGFLRRAGYATESRPKKGDTGWSGVWTKEGFGDIYLWFTSTLCKQVKVGTKTQTVEVPIFETVCGDVDLNEALPRAVGSSESVTMIDDDIPF